MSFYQDSPFTLGVGGSKGILALWDTSENQGVERRFGSRAPAGSASSGDISSSFRSPAQLGEELARQDELERQQVQAGKGKKKAGKGKKK